MDDLIELVSAIGDKLDVIMIPKVEGAWDIHYVDRLVAQGLVNRMENPEDRRMMTLEVSDKGRAILSNLKETGLTHMTEILALLSTEELAALAQGMAALVKAAEGNLRR